MSRFTYTAEDVLRAAGTLWQSRNPETQLSSLQEDERERAWANLAADVEVVLKALGGELKEER